ncbi:hypothetical protein DFH08DRAFT_1019744 [Mycena albidolilacea]|uniref:Uncharacterized protein n=1 Tax=Mycena albidolilacea TaxID=1033008 RepID=A0AAD6ZPQ5_9AGAR|nr:hypothetical protein DFH08DRAFT_1019744 [Mycena albidolilacea]
MLLAMGGQHLEHFVVFSLDRQSIISSVITGASTTFAALYSSVLVLLTQSLAIRRKFLVKQTVTATHDNISAWTGLGAALLGMLNQRSIPASVIETFSVFLYLLNISVVHISTPSLLSLQTFNYSFPTNVTTQGVPQYTESAVATNSTDIDRYIPSLLGTMPDKMDNSNKLGLLDGTLYDVLDDSYTAPDTTVAAVGFNITCQYLPHPNVTWDGSTMTWEVVYPAPFPGIRVSPRLRKPAAGTIEFLFSDNDTLSNSVTMLLVGLQVSDSKSNTPIPITLDPPMIFPSFAEPVTEVQFIRCSQTLVKQIATINTQTQKAITLEPDIRKQGSARSWSPYNGTVPTGFDAELQQWAKWLAAGYSVNFGLSSNASDVMALQFSSMFLIDYLNLWPAPGQQRPSNITLSSLEDAVACLNAPDGKTISSAAAASPVTLLRGSATVYQHIPKARLHASVGPAASICLTLLSLYFCRDQSGSHISFSGSGFLHAIWLFRSHSDLETVLPHVEKPTQNNLRTAGMVPVKLIDQSRMEKYGDN